MHIRILLPNETHWIDLGIGIKAKATLYKNNRDYPQINFTTSNAAINFLIALIEIASYHHAVFFHLPIFSIGLEQYFNFVDCSNFAYSIELCVCAQCAFIAMLLLFPFSCVTKDDKKYRCRNVNSIVNYSSHKKTQIRSTHTSSVYGISFRLQ